MRETKKKKKKKTFMCASFALPLKVHIEKQSKGSLFRGRGGSKIKSVNVKFQSTTTISEARKLVATLSNIGDDELKSQRYDLFLPAPYDGKAPRFLGDESDQQTTLVALALRKNDLLEFKPRPPSTTTDRIIEQHIAGAMLLYKQAEDAEARKEFADAAVLWKQAADAGVVNALYKLGLLFEYGDGVAMNLPTAIALYVKAAEAGVAEAASQLGFIYFYGKNGALERDYLAGLQFWLLAVQLSEGKDSEALFALGCRFHVGVPGVTKPNLEQAVRFYAMAAAANSSSACSNLGFCHYQGFGTDQNYAAAVAFFRRGMQLKSTEATFMLAICYELGRGVQLDTATASQLYGQVASQRIVNGEESDNCAIQVAKAVCLERGFGGTQQNYARALELLLQAVRDIETYAKSTDDGLELHFAVIWAMFKLGELYWNGRAVPVNVQQAVYWFDRAAQLGHLDARASLDVIRVATSRQKLESDTYERLGSVFVSATMSFGGGNHTAAQRTDNATRRKKLLRFAPAAAFWFDIIVAGGGGGGGDDDDDDTRLQQVSWPRFSSALFCELLAPQRIDWQRWCHIEQQVRAIFDTNNDGEVSFEEYDTATATRQQTILQICMSLLQASEIVIGVKAKNDNNSNTTKNKGATRGDSSDRLLIEQIAGFVGAKFEDAVSHAVKEPEAVMLILDELSAAAAASKLFGSLSVVADCSGAIAVVLGIAAVIVEAHMTAVANDQRIQRLCKRVESMQAVLEQVRRFVQEQATPSSADTIEALKRPLEHLVVAMRGVEAAASAWRAISASNGKGKVVQLKRWMKRTVNASAHADRLDESHRAVSDAIDSITAVSSMRAAINTSRWESEDEQDKSAWLEQLLQRDAEFKEALASDMSGLQDDLRSMGKGIEAVLTQQLGRVFESVDLLTKKMDQVIDFLAAFNNGERDKLFPQPSTTSAPRPRPTPTPTPTPPQRDQRPNPFATSRVPAQQQQQQQQQQHQQQHQQQPTPLSRVSSAHLPPRGGSNTTTTHSQPQPFQQQRRGSGSSSPTSSLPKSSSTTAIMASLSGVTRAPTPPAATTQSTTSTPQQPKKIGVVVLPPK
jgi:TPR repeat protein